MKSLNPSRYNERLLFMLSNAVKATLKDIRVPLTANFPSRTSLFRSLHRFNQAAQKSTIKPRNLYVIPYSRYCTLRFILVDRDVEQENYDDDLIIKTKFATMMSKHYDTHQALEEAFFEHIRDLKTDDIFAQYVALDKKILSSQLSEEEMTEVLVAMSGTDALLADELAKDINLYSTKTEKILQWLRKYRDLSGWMVAGGVTCSVLTVLLRSTF